MARIAGVTIPQNKIIVVSLTYLFGVGPSLAQRILDKLKIDPAVRTKDLPELDVNRLRDYIEKNFRVEGDLRRDVWSNIKRLKEIGSYRGGRHARGLPVRGQRTKTNSRTRRGNVRRTMGSGRKDASQKT